MELALTADKLNRHAGQTKPRLLTLECLLLYIAFFSFAIERFLVYINASWYIVSSGDYAQDLNRSAVSNILFIIAILSFLCLALIAIFQSTNKLRIGEFYTILMLLFFSFCWTLQSLEKNSFAEVFINNGSPMTMIYVLGIYIGDCDKLWKHFQKISFIFALIFTFLSFTYTLMFTLQHGFLRRFGSSAPMDYFIIAFWFIAIIILTMKKFPTYSVILLHISLDLLIIVSIISRSRSWILLTLFLLIVLIIRTVHIKKIALLSLLTQTVISIALFALFYHSIVNASNIVFNRISEDSRSSQLIAFFEQVKIGQLVFGGGIDAAYSFHNNTAYRYIDNQVLFLMFHYGIFMTLLYLWILIKPILMSFRRQDKEMQSVSIILFLWVLAMLGLSVYNSITINIPNAIIMILCGRAYHLLHNNMEYKKSYV